ncbi:signal recognition particle-docking protein FtsY [Candidatus Bathyarchaeota archaeon]|jgi:fused signal recognition particle receptor|nr:signal recognition particle-docking protein FtsY [Candidatus Bathyarchaeota archaeon]MBT6605255.1 signal recognition particle-docking protein FtsY [Candidatus Bathyarchaeota archaeon]MBT7915167.1 signal recognition particle-docking protein FtsY [Candidatus Bathyarchaeota archaeon]
MFEKLRKGLKGIVSKISNSGFTDKDLEPLLWDLQIQLISNDVSVEVAEKVCVEMKERLMGTNAPRFGDKSDVVRTALRESLEAVMDCNNKLNIFEKISQSKKDGEPFSVMFVGINGTGKTTTIAKFTHKLQEAGYSVVLASGDTYRAGAIEQLEEHGRRLGVRVIRHKYGSDAAAVGFDAVEHARAQGIDVVLIDTAGRMQTNRNLMDELQKVKRVVDPNFTIMILDSLIGNDATEQAMTFNDFIGFDAAILTKVDADAKGGSSLSVPYLTGKPVLYVGVGQEYDDLEPFDAQRFAEKLLAD